jgi:hypothetical protein
LPASITSLGSVQAAWWFAAGCTIIARSKSVAGQTWSNPT